MNIIHKKVNISSGYPQFLTKPGISCIMNGMESKKTVNTEEGRT